MSCFKVEVSSLDVRSCKWRRLYHSWCIAQVGSSSFISLKDDRQNVSFMLYTFFYKIDILEVAKEIQKKLSMEVA